MFPPEKTESKNENPHIINAHNYPNTVSIIEDVKPDLVLINGSIDFHNIEVALAAKFKKIPLVTFFFRNIVPATIYSPFDTVRIRIRGLFSNKVSDNNSVSKGNRLKWFRFYLNQFHFLRKTIQAMNYNLFQQINFIIFYTKTIMFCPAPIHKAISGNRNLCSVSKWVERLTNHEFIKSSIFLVGDPYFDQLYSEIQKNKNDQHFNSDKTGILFCTSTMHEHDYCSKNEEYNLIKNTILEILSHERLEVAVKIHPSTASREEFVEEIMKKLPTKIELYQKENLVNLLNQYDIMVSYGGSGAILYGVLLGKPVINLQFNTRATGNNVWIDDNLIIKCESFNTLVSNIMKSKKTIFQKKHYDNFIKTNLGIFDGRSSERAAIVITEILNDNVIDCNH